MLASILPRKGEKHMSEEQQYTPGTKASGGGAITVGDVVQVSLESGDGFGGCFIIVSEVKEWGVQGYAVVPGLGGRAFYRARLADVQKIGRAVWADEDAAEGSAVHYPNGLDDPQPYVEG